ncbi:MAG: hypothetical protein KDB80_16900 [Planctomycetes bacterium]|nr:hypothetical protein [Planctomycetota bacterium]
MDAFAARTGLRGDRPDTRRYLWTDAFAVCNFLELYRRTSEPAALETALRLVDRVHQVLGRHRPDEPHQGWLSGLGDEAGCVHPTAGGLRIGKDLPERSVREPFDERLEWERDGQYFHYLTRWMHALTRLRAATGDERWLGQAIELARIAHRGFVYRPHPGARPRMFWKMSIDLSRPQVPSMGHHDPLDGWLTTLELCAQAGRSPEELGLADAVGDLHSMCVDTDWATVDLLGLGGLLVDAYRSARLTLAGMIERGVLERILGDVLRGVAASARSWPFDRLPDHRLAFRELGFAIGLHALPKLRDLVATHEVSASVESSLTDLMKLVPLAGRIEQFWLEPRNRSSRSFVDHEDIDAVMLATSLVPDGYLEIDVLREA